MFCVIHRVNGRPVAVYGPYKSVKDADDDVENNMDTHPVTNRDENEESPHNYDIIPFHAPYNK